MASSPYSCVLWDVDGTIVDASVGILRRLNVALTHFGHPAPTREELVHWIGPPMFQSFQAQAGMTPEESAEAVTFYRTLGKADGYTTDVAPTPACPRSSAICTPPECRRRPRARSPRSRSTRSSTSSNCARTSSPPSARRPTSRPSRRRPTSWRRRCAAWPIAVPTSRARCSSATATTMSRAATRTACPVIFVEWGFSDPNEGDEAAFRAASVDELRALLLA